MEWIKLLKCNWHVVAACGVFIILTASICAGPHMVIKRLKSKLLENQVGQAELAAILIAQTYEIGSSDTFSLGAYADQLASQYGFYSVGIVNSNGLIVFPPSDSGSSVKIPQTDKKGFKKWVEEDGTIYVFQSFKSTISKDSDVRGLVIGLNSTSSSSKSIGRYLWFLLCLVGCLGLASYTLLASSSSRFSHLA